MVLSTVLYLIVGFLIALKVYAKYTAGKCLSSTKLNGKVAIVTGANIGIGYETAKDLANRGAKVILACRDTKKGTNAADQIKRETGSSQVIVKRLDLSSLKSVREFCNEIKTEETRLDILVNNAGGSMPNKSVTEDGLETNFQANHFGPFLLTNLLLDLLNKSPSARIVNVASVVHNFARSLDLANLNSEKSWEPMMVYFRTKLANILFTRELDRRLHLAGISNITVNALHPGYVKTAFFRHVKEESTFVRVFGQFSQFFSKNPEEGAQTTIHVAVAEELEGVSGLYFSDCKPANTTCLAKDINLARKLWDVSADFVHLKSEDSVVATLADKSTN